MPYIQKPLKIYDAIVVATNQAAPHHDPDYRKSLTSVTYQLTSAGTPTFSAQIKQSLDGVVWQNVGSAIVALSVVTVVIVCPYWKIDVASLSVANLTISMG
jgi:hypothetical protein